jgi:hypothetical protein
MSILLLLICSAILIPLFLLAAFLFIINQIYSSIQPAPGRDSTSLLAQHLPCLQNVAFSLLGTFPSPIHKATIDDVSFYIKREDLTSSIYGGNKVSISLYSLMYKVRTLQHQIPVCEAQLQANPSSHFFVLGSFGSNQTVATLSHSSRALVDALTVCLIKPDSPDLDNVLNVLSCLRLKAF